MTHLPKHPPLAAPGACEGASSSLGYEYRLSQPMTLESGEFGDSAAVPLELMDAREVQALKQWRHSLLALRHAISGHR